MDIIISLTDIVAYEECIKNMLLYWYNDYITLYDGINEVIIKKTEISYIYSTYNSKQPIFNRYITSRVFISLKNGDLIKIDISSSPQDSPGPKGYLVKTILSNTYVFDTSILTYTNGYNTTQNSYYDLNGNIIKIDGLEITTYYRVLSFYDTLKAVGIDIQESFRNDARYDVLIDGKYVGIPTGIKSNNNTVSNITNAVFQFEADIGFEKTDTNILTWRDQINNVKLTAIKNAVFNNTLSGNNNRCITINNDSKYLLAADLSLNKFGIDINSSITICWVGGVTGGFSGPAYNDIIILGNNINDVRIGVMNTDTYRVYYSNSPINQTASNIYNIGVSNIINTISFHCITIEKLTGDYAKIQYYCNNILRGTLSSVPYKLNIKSSLVIRGKHRSGVDINTAGFYLFGKLLSITDMNNLYNYVKTIFGQTPTGGAIEGEYAGIYNLQCDYGVVKNNNQIVTWSPKCSRIVNYVVNGTITQDNNNLTPTGKQAIVLSTSAELSGNAQNGEILSINPAYELYTRPGNGIDHTIFFVIYNSRLAYASVYGYNYIDADPNWSVYAKSVKNTSGSNIEINTYTNNRLNVVTTSSTTSSYGVIYGNVSRLAEALSGTIQIAAFIVFDGILSNSDLDYMFNYLNVKYITG